MLYLSPFCCAATSAVPLNLQGEKLGDVRLTASWVINVRPPVLTAEPAGIVGAEPLTSEQAIDMVTVPVAFVPTSFWPLAVTCWESLFLNSFSSAGATPAATSTALAALSSVNVGLTAKIGRASCRERV